MSPSSSDMSVIIPVYNDPQGLEHTVDSLLDQRAPAGNYEIIIADNGSTDMTWTVAMEFAKQHPDRVNAVRETQIQSSYAARNRGLQAARGDYISFLDADMTAPKNYLRDLSRRFHNGDADYIGCAVEVITDDSNLSSIYNSLTGFPIQRYLEKDHYAPTCCLAIRRSLVERVGPFDDRLESGGDMEFGQRVFEAGFTQEFAPEIELRHPARSSYQSLLGKCRRIARGHAQLSHYFPDRYDLFLDIYLATTRTFLPGDPLRYHRLLNAAKLDVAPWVPLGLAGLQIPLAWAGLIAYLDEARRLTKRSSHTNRRVIS